MNTTIEFTKLDKTYLGRVTFDGTELVGDNEFAKGMIEEYVESGELTPEQFVQRYANYGSSFLYAKAV